MRTVELTDDADPAELLEAASEREAEAERLRLERERLLEEAREYRQHAELVKIWRGRVSVPKVSPRLIRDRRGGEVPEKDYEIVTNVLRELQPTSLQVLAKRLGVSAQVARNRVKVLEERGVATQFAQRQWCLTGYEPPKDEKALIRDIGMELDVFTVADILEVTDIDEPRVHAILAEWVENGTFEVEDGVYAYSPPESKAVNRPRRTPVEREAVTSGPSRGAAIAGTGRGMRVTDDEVRAYVEQVKAAGAEVVRSDSHFVVKYRGKTLPSIPKTPSDHRALLNNRSQLRAAGLPI